MAEKTNNGKKGGWLVGKRHYSKDGKPLGGIKAIVTDAGGKPVELEGGEVIINREASRKHWKELSRINQSDRKSTV
jgi:acyl-coenzyme A synthetase/AMP-(fatty) acid ligase